MKKSQYLNAAREESEHSVVTQLELTWTPLSPGNDIRTSNRDNNNNWAYNNIGH